MSIPIWGWRPVAVAMGALVVCAAQAQTQTHVFNIPAGALKDALDTYAAQSGVQLIYRTADVRDVRTKGASGTLADDAALDRLLEGTPLAVRREAAGAVLYRREAAAAAPDDDTLSVVTVTAQKRPEAAQSVPIAMTNFTSHDIDTYRIDNLQDASRLTPGLLVSAFSLDSPTIAIRGTNNTFSQIGVSKPVAVVVDDVFVPRNSAAIFDLFDLDSINVLKGPQGTLFGRNVTGGAIVINTRKPSFDKAEAEARVTAGNYGDTEFQGMLNAPLTDDLAAKVATSVHHREGTGVDRLTGEREDGIDSANARAQVRLAVRDDLEVLLSADVSHDDNGGRTLSSDTLGDDGNPRTSELGVPQRFVRSISGGSARVNWDTHNGDWTSITAYRKSSSSETYSGVGANWQFLTSGSQSVIEDSDDVGTFSQEIRWASPRWSQGDLVAGAYFMSEHGTRERGEQDLAAKTGKSVVFTLADQAVQTNSLAGFVDGTLRLPSDFSLSTGLRYTVDRKAGSLTRTDYITPANTFSDSSLKDTWRDWTPRLALTWQPTRSALAYASVTRGFTSGGFNEDASSLQAYRQTFAPETVTNVEAGVKTQWFDDRLRINLSVFDMKYHDKQEFVFDSVTSILDVVNAARATIKGTETEVAYKPVSWLGLHLTHSWLDTRYDDFVIGTVNNTGHPLSAAPKDTWSTAADASWPLAGRGYLNGTVSYFHTAKYNTGAANDPNLEIPAYGLTNASVGLESLDHRWRLTAWGKNLANTDYILTRSTQVVRAEYLGEPRTWGVTLSVKY